MLLLWFLWLKWYVSWVDTDGEKSDCDINETSETLVLAFRLFLV